MISAADAPAPAQPTPTSPATAAEQPVCSRVDMALRMARAHRAADTADVPHVVVEQVLADEVDRLRAELRRLDPIEQRVLELVDGALVDPDEPPSSDEASALRVEVELLRGDLDRTRGELDGTRAELELRGAFVGGATVRDDLAHALITTDHRAAAEHVEREIGGRSCGGLYGPDGACGGCIACVYAQLTHTDHTPEGWARRRAEADALLVDVRRSMAHRTARCTATPTGGA